MANVGVKHKINKYSKKLHDALNCNKIVNYQDKLNYYGGSAQSGGGFDGLKRSVSSALINMEHIKQKLNGIQFESVEKLGNDVLAVKDKFEKLVSESVEVGLEAKKLVRSTIHLREQSEELQHRADEGLNGQLNTLKSQLENLANGYDYGDITEFTIETGAVLDAAANPGRNTPIDLTDFINVASSAIQRFGEMSHEEKTEYYSQSTHALGRIGTIQLGDEFDQVKASFAEFEKLLKEFVTKLKEASG